MKNPINGGKGKGVAMNHKRGILTDRIKVRSKTLLGYTIDQDELRLMAYIIYIMMNEQKMKSELIRDGEGEILKKWKKAGYIKGGASGLRITKNFWNIMTEIVWLGYVHIDID